MVGHQAIRTDFNSKHLAGFPKGIEEKGVAFGILEGSMTVQPTVHKMGPAIRYFKS